MSHLHKATILLTLLLAVLNPAIAQTPATAEKASPETATVCAKCIRQNMEFLASDTLRGRGSGTSDELKAAKFVASKLKAYGIGPGDDDYIQDATVVRRVVTKAPELKFTVPGDKPQRITWMHGKEMLVLRMAEAEVSGPLQRVETPSGRAKIQPGSVVFLVAVQAQDVRRAISAAVAAGAAAIIVPDDPSFAKLWSRESGMLPQLPLQIRGAGEGGLSRSTNAIAVRAKDLPLLEKVPEGSKIVLSAPINTVVSDTWNAVGKIVGSDPSQVHDAVLFSAHLDHLGIGAPVHGDNIYNGADDDASGVAAVLELARVLGSGQKPKRTVIFALFGSEERGGLGSTYFREHSPVPLEDIAVNLEFEMIGRPDRAVKADTLWLTGWERSNLGPALAEHGALLVKDPHPEQDFFARSDNYVLARRGIVAQTISSYGLHQQYHQPSDDLAHIDFKHMDEAIGSLLSPLNWLVNSDFKPQWNEGGRP